MVPQPSIRSQNQSSQVRRILKRISKIVFSLLAMLIGAILVIILGTTLFLHLRLLAVSPGIEKAIHTTYPLFCSFPDNQLVIEHAALSLNIDLWDVTCGSSKPHKSSGAEWVEPFLTVNVATCEVTRPMLASLDWDTIYGDMIRKNPAYPKLSTCP